MLSGCCRLRRGLSPPGICERSALANSRGQPGSCSGQNWLFKLGLSLSDSHCHMVSAHPISQAGIYKHRYVHCLIKTKDRTTGHVGGLPSGAPVGLPRPGRRCSIPEGEPDSPAVVPADSQGQFPLPTLNAASSLLFISSGKNAIQNQAVDRLYFASLWFE